MTRTTKTLLAAALVLLALVLGVIGGALFVVGRYLGDIERIPMVFASLEESQRPQLTGSARTTTFLLVGTDARAGGQTSGSGAEEADAGARADTIMIARINDRDGVDVLSIPRDSWVDVPGHGMNKINAAYAYGGPTLLVQTVERLTSIRIDHFAVIDFNGFKELTNALGGVEVDVPFASTNLGYTFTEGRQLMDGDEALAYVRQRYGLPGGDFDRMRRQQSYLVGMAAELSESKVFSNPSQVREILGLFSEAVSVDDTLSKGRALVLAARLGGMGVNSGNVHFDTAPISGQGREGEQSVVYLDEEQLGTVWSHLGKSSHVR